MIPQIANLYEIQFPIYITKPIIGEITDIVIENGIKKLVFNNTKITYDMILDTESTYLGRLIVLNRLADLTVIEFDYSFTNLAHLIYARPKFDYKSLLVDNLGQVRRLKPIYAKGVSRRYSHRRGTYVFTRAVPTPLQIPQFPLLLDSLDTYEPYLELAVYRNSYFFKNILEKARHPHKTWKIQIT